MPLNVGGLLDGDDDDCCVGFVDDDSRIMIIMQYIKS